MRSIFALPVLLLCCLSPHAPAASEVLRLHGSNTIGERLAPALVEAWRRETHPVVEQRRVGAVEVDVLAGGARGSGRHIAGETSTGELSTVEIRAHGSSTAFAALAAGRADIGLSSRPVSAAEVSRLHARLGALDEVPQEVVLALDGLAIIVHPSKPLVELDVATVRRIFAGEIRSWSQLGAPGGAIALHARDEVSGTWDSFRSLVLGDTPLSRVAVRYESTDLLAAAVGADPGAIGFVGLVGVGHVRSLAISSGGAALLPSRDLVAVKTMRCRDACTCTCRATRHHLRASSPHSPWVIAARPWSSSSASCRRTSAHTRRPRATTCRRSIATSPATPSACR